MEEVSCFVQKTDYEILKAHSYTFVCNYANKCAQYLEINFISDSWYYSVMISSFYRKVKWMLFLHTHVNTYIAMYHTLYLMHASLCSGVQVH